MKGLWYADEVRQIMQMAKKAHGTRIFGLNKECGKIIKSLRKVQL